MSEGGVDAVWVRHNCTRKHRSYQTLAKCIWNDSPWIVGDGPIALVSCQPRRYRHGAVTLHDDVEAALPHKRQIDDTACGGACHGDHRLIRLVLS